MKFKIDENLPLEFAQVLRAAGHDAVTVLEEALSGVTDPEVLSVCGFEDRAIVTLDIDFADIRLYPPEETPGIIVFRVRSQDKPHLLSCLRRLIPLMEKESLRSRLWIVEEDRIRIRGDLSG
jgi:predicted nuclease of predicted toxin-antitoxin system